MTAQMIAQDGCAQADPATVAANDEWRADLIAERRAALRLNALHAALAHASSANSDWNDKDVVRFAETFSTFLEG